MGLQHDDGSDFETPSGSSAIGSPLWPQSFGRTMDLYCRSTSQRSQDASGLEPGVGANALFEPCSTPTREAREPLLGKLERRQSESYVTTGNGAPGAEVDTGLHLTPCEVNNSEPAGSSFFQALFHGMNVLAGVGILSTPYAAAKGGWLALALLVVFACICCYTVILLRRCLDSHLHIRSYPDVGEASFEKWGRWITSIVLYLELYAVAIEFLILEGDNLAHLFPSAGITWGHMALSPHEVFVILSAVCMLPTVWLRELSILSYVSATGVVASFLIVITVGWIGLLDGVGFHHHGSLVH